MTFMDKIVICLTPLFKNQLERPFFAAWFPLRTYILFKDLLSDWYLVFNIPRRIRSYLSKFWIGWLNRQGRQNKCIDGKLCKLCMSSQQYYIENKYHVLRQSYGEFPKFFVECKISKKNKLHIFFGIQVFSKQLSLIECNYSHGPP